MRLLLKLFASLIAAPLLTGGLLVWIFVPRKDRS